MFLIVEHENAVHDVPSEKVPGYPGGSRLKGGDVRLGNVIDAFYGTDTNHSPRSLFNPYRQSLELARAFQGAVTPIT